MATVTTYSVAGANTWTAPEGVTSVQVEVWAGGGGGGSNNRTGNNAGGGGGGGGYSRSNVTVVPTTEYNLSVGAGGNNVTGNTTGGAGGNSWFNSNEVRAQGGSGGTAAGAGGAPGSIANGIGTIVFRGGNGAGKVATGIGGGAGASGGNAADGANGSGQTGGSGAGGGGTGGNGGAAGGSGSNGTQPGAGGGGKGNAAQGFSGNGAIGQVVLTYTANVTLTQSEGAKGTDSAPTIATAATTLTEGGKAADEAHIRFSFPLDAEEAKTSDSAEVTVQQGAVQDSGTEQANTADSAPSVAAGVSTRTDGGKCSDSASVTITRPAQTLIEGAKASDSAAATVTRQAQTLTEGAKAADSAPSTAAAGSTRTDGAKAADTATPTITRTPLTVSDGATAADTSTSSQSGGPIEETVSEQAKTADTPTPHAAALSARSDEAKVADTAHLRFTFPLDGEQARAADTAVPQAATPVTASDTGKAADSATSWAGTVVDVLAEDGAKTADLADLSHRQYLRDYVSPTGPNGSGIEESTALPVGTWMGLGGLELFLAMNAGMDGSYQQGRNRWGLTEVGHADGVIARFSTAPLKAQTIPALSLTVGLALKTDDAAAFGPRLMLSAYVWRHEQGTGPNNGFVVGYLYDSHDPIGPFWTGEPWVDKIIATVPITSVAAQDGDVITVEVWVHADQTDTNQHYAQLLYNGGTPVAPGVTGDYASWIELPLVTYVETTVVAEEATAYDAAVAPTEVAAGDIGAVGDSATSSETIRPTSGEGAAGAEEIGFAEYSFPGPTDEARLSDSADATGGAAADQDAGIVADEIGEAFYDFGGPDDGVKASDTAEAFYVVFATDGAHAADTIPEPGGVYPVEASDGARAADATVEQADAQAFGNEVGLYAGDTGVAGQNILLSEATDAAIGWEIAQVAPVLAFEQAADSARTTDTAPAARVVLTVIATDGARAADGSLAGASFTLVSASDGAKASDQTLEGETFSALTGTDAARAADTGVPKATVPVVASDGARAGDAGAPGEFYLNVVTVADGARATDISTSTGFFVYTVTATDGARGADRAHTSMGGRAMHRHHRDVSLRTKHDADIVLEPTDTREIT